MELNLDIEQQDFDAFQSHIVYGGKNRFAWLQWIVLVSVTALILYTVNNSSFSSLSNQIFLGAIIGIIAWIIFITRYNRNLIQLDRDGYVLGRQTMALSERGIRTTKQAMNSEMSWKLVKRIIETREHLLIQVDRLAALIIPKRCLTESELGSLRQLLSDQAPGAMPAVLPSTDTAPPFEKVGFIGNLIAGAKLTFLRKVTEYEFKYGFGQIVAFIAVAVCAEILFDLVVAGPNAQFSSYGISASATLYLLFFAGAFLLGFFLKDYSFTKRFVLVMLTVFPYTWLPYLIVYAILDHLAAWDTKWVYGTVWGWWYVIYIWYLIIVVRGIQMLKDVQRIRAIGLSFCYFLVSVVPAFWLPNDEFWYSYDNDVADTPRPSINVERTYARQDDLLKASAVKTHRPGIVDLYFVGFGAYARQNVFMSEIRRIRELFENKFDTGGHSVSLINNVETIDNVPLATGTNLQKVFNDVAQKMDKDEDILFLYLTSHGSKDGRLAVSFWPLRPNDFTAQDLRQWLDESGIIWRVIVVSACYSGSFIDALQSDTTLILTAASPEKTSFGCSNKNEYTYFGEAYFKDSLSRNFSFIDAFDQATQIVSEREIAEKLVPSEPQKSVGIRIDGKLKALEFQLSKPSVH